MYQGLGYDIEQVMPEARATGLFVSLCTLQEPSGVFGASGAPDGNYVDVAGLVNLPCTAPPPSEARIQAIEVKTLQDIMSLELLHVLLNDAYPAILTHFRGTNATEWRAVIDGVVYDLFGAESDSQSEMTRLLVRLAKT